MRGQPELYQLLDSLSISFDYYEHPPVPTVKEAAIYWQDIDAAHCKNLFFRNHKGNKHYLVILEFSKELDIHAIEQKLKQGKLTFASERRLKDFLGVEPGSVSLFSLINDINKHVHVFLDFDLKCSKKLSFHPNINTASLVITNDSFLKFLEHSRNNYEFIQV